MEETWKEVVGYEGLYEISNLGRVRSHHPSPRRKSEFLKDANIRGYRMVVLSKGDGSKPKSALVHRLVAIAFLGEAPDVRRPTVNHKNLNKADNRVENLEWLSHADNNRHAAPLIPHQRGEERPNAKLTEQSVREMRARYSAGGITFDELGAQFGISGTYCHIVVRRKKWKHVV